VNHQNSIKEGLIMINKSAFVTRKKHIEIIESQLPPITSNEVRVQIKACGICGTDMHFYNTFEGGTPTPLGHEVAGTIVEIGDNINDVQVGQDVVVQNNVACGVCKNCTMRRVEYCSNIQTYMNDQSGFASYLTVDRNMVIKFSGLDYAQATLAEPMTVAMDLFQEADIKKEDSVLIMGPGVIGLSLLYLVSHVGASSIGVVGHHLDTTRGKYRKEVAKKFGADVVFDSSEANWKENVLLAFPDGFSKVIITSPPKTIPDGIELAGFGGYIVYDGISFSEDSITFGANDFHFNKKRLIASHAIPNYGFPYALELLKKDPELSKYLLTHRYSFNEIEKGFLGYDSNDEKIIKTVIEL
jgi:threonine dehydrogenase-like Zn-dependent dehydrogenase